MKWLLLSLTAGVPAESEVHYRLEFGKSVQRRPVEDPLVVAEVDGCVQIDTGVKRFVFDASGCLIESGVYQTVAEDADGVAYQTSGTDAETTVEESGPIRAVIKTVAPLADKDGNPLFRIEKRIEVYRGTPFVRVHHTFVVDRPERFTTIRSLSYRVPAGAQTDSWRAALAGDRGLDVNRSQAVRQQTDERLLRVSGGTADVEESRLVGSLIPTGDNACAVAVRDGWQNYPKASR